LAFIIRIHHEAPSFDCQKRQLLFKGLKQPYKPERMEIKYGHPLGESSQYQTYVLVLSQTVGSRGFLDTKIGFF